MKKITLEVDDITPKQWTTLVLELNIMRKSWRPYGVDIKFLGHGIKKIVEWGNKRNDNSKRTRQDSKSLLEDEEKKYKDLWYQEVKKAYGKNINNSSIIVRRNSDTRKV